jgi:hypothetical protein
MQIRMAFLQWHLLQNGDPLWIVKVLPNFSPKNLQKLEISKELEVWKNYLEKMVQSLFYHAIKIVPPLFALFAHSIFQQHIQYHI